MPSLKHFIAGTAGVSHLFNSPLCEQDVATITPAQMCAFVAKLKMQHRGDEAESALDIAMRTVEEAADRGEIPHPQMLAYQRPNFIVMTHGEMRRALAFLQPAQAVAIVFALETGMTAQEVACFTHQELSLLRRTKPLSQLAEACIKRMPRNLATPYVFWRTEETDDQVRTLPGPMMDLDEAVFNAFGMLWGELEQGYEHLIYIDDEAAAEDVVSFFAR